MKYNRLIYLILSFLIMCGNITAQQGNVRGIITDRNSGSSLTDAVITDAAGRVLGSSTSDGSFVIATEAGKQMLFIDLADYEQVIISVTVTAGETTDAGTIAMPRLTNLINDFVSVNATEGVSEDSFESQAIQGALSASADIFLSTSAYTFGPVMYRVRGYDANYQNVSLNGFVVNDIESGSPYYSNWGGLNDVMRSAMVSSGPEPIGFLFEPVGGATRINTRASEYRSGIKAVYSLSNRTYRNRAMLTYSTGLMNNNWAFTGSYSRRWSERGYEQGTYYDANSFFLSAEKKINSRHSLNLTALDAIYERGVGGGSTQEAYDITGDVYYNPYWGLQNGEVRSARVRSNNKPLITLTHFWKPSEKLDIQTTTGYWFGKSGYSALNWYDVLDPRPDYYRKLPSYYSDQSDIDRITDTWSDPSVSQIDWDHFYYANRKNIFTVPDEGGISGNSLSGNRSKYIVEDRRNDISQFQFNIRAAWDISERFNITGGLLADIYRGHNFNVVKDLLGGDYWLDVDQFAERDFPNDPDAFQSDLNNPNNAVTEGETFGNSYYAIQRGATLWGTGRYSNKRYSVYLSAHARYTEMWREGLMRKGLFPDNSYGESEHLSYPTWGIKAGGDFRITGRHMIVLNTLYTRNPPLFRNVFLSPRTRNSITPGLGQETIISGDISYILRSPVVRARVTGYYTRFNDQTEVTSFYHDEWRTLVNYAMSGIDKENYGIEAGAEISLTSELSVNAVASIGQYLWVTNPAITITKDNNSEVLSTEEVWIKYFRQSGTPQTALAAGIEYNSSRFWWAGVTGSYYDQIYLDFNPVTRTKDETGYYPYWEQQKQVDPGFLIDIFVGKSWLVKDIYINLSANLSNVLNNRSFVTGGFEQYRFDPDNPDLFQPKIYYYNGFNYFINFSIRY
ncbi:MAG: TonB-dependent receptor [Bacteroidales bacterium]|nr:TonB-dependent receptor [Bacteroidales bacterium]